MVYAGFYNELTVNEVIARLGHSDVAVRTTALKMLAKVLQKVDEHTVATVSTKLESLDEGVRCTAIGGFSRKNIGFFLEHPWVFF